MNDPVQACRREWRRLGVPRETADEMAAELEADLGSAAAAGDDASTVIGPDARSFAAAWAGERGVVRPRLRLGLTAAAAVLGAVPGAGFALFVAYGLSSSGMTELLGSTSEPYTPPEWLLLPLYVLGGAFAYAGAVGAVAITLRLRGDLAAGLTVRALTAILPVGTAAAVGATVLLAWTRGFTVSLPVAIAEAMVAAGVFATVAAAIRLWAVQRERAGLVGTPCRDIVGA